MLGRIISGISAVAYVGAFVLGLRYVLEMTFSAGSPIIMRIAVIVMAALAFVIGYFAREAEKSGEDNAQ